MAKAGSSWRIATLRPGEDPIGHLAAVSQCCPTCWEGMRSWPAQIACCSKPRCIAARWGSSRRFVKRGFPP